MRLSAPKIRFGAVLGLVVAYNLVGNLWLPSSLYVPANLAMGAVLVAIARRSGVTWEQLGLAPSGVAAGLRLGGIVMAVIGAGIAVGVAWPFTRELFEDDRIAEASTAELIYQPLVRIPLGTAVFEEVVFRGVLLGMLLVWLSPLWAATWSSALFGLWHVVPAALSVDNTEAFGSLTDTRAGLVVAVVGSVVVTGLGGYVFCWLRFRANSLVAPILFHTATNSFAYVGATVSVRLL